MTSDGIAAADWDLVHELAVEIANCSAAENEPAEARARAALIEVLDRLDKKYGRKASLLATRADYVESIGEREQLLLAAHAEAEHTADAVNEG